MLIPLGGTPIRGCRYAQFGGSPSLSRRATIHSGYRRSGHSAGTGRPSEALGPSLTRSSPGHNDVVFDERGAPTLPPWAWHRNAVRADIGGVG